MGDCLLGRVKACKTQREAKRQAGMYHLHQALGSKKQLDNIACVLLIPKCSVKDTVALLVHKFNLPLRVSPLQVSPTTLVDDGKGP